jgi:hypothetical protein
MGCGGHRGRQAWLTMVNARPTLRTAPAMAGTVLQHTRGRGGEKKKVHANPGAAAGNGDDKRGGGDADRGTSIPSIRTPIPSIRTSIPSIPTLISSGQPTLATEAAPVLPDEHHRWAVVARPEAKKTAECPCVCPCIRPAPSPRPPHARPGRRWLPHRALAEKTAEHPVPSQAQPLPPFSFSF